MFWESLTKDIFCMNWCILGNLTLYIDCSETQIGKGESGKKTILIASYEMNLNLLRKCNISSTIL